MNGPGTGCYRGRIRYFRLFRRRCLHSCRGNRRMPRAKWTLGFITAAIPILMGCRPDSGYQAPPPPKVTVVQPTVETVPIFLEENGQTEAVEQAVVQARVRGILQEIKIRSRQSCHRRHSAVLDRTTGVSGRRQIRGSDRQLGQGRLGDGRSRPGRGRRQNCGGRCGD